MGLACANPLIHMGLIGMAHGLAWLGELTDRLDGLLMGLGACECFWGGTYHFRVLWFISMVKPWAWIVLFPCAFPYSFPNDKHGPGCFSFLFFCAVFTPLIDLCPIDWLFLLFRDT
jgi:hypothetical protein